MKDKVLWKMGLTLAVLLAGLAWVTPVRAVPILPASFWGVVTNADTGAPAPTGIAALALVNGMVVGQTTTFAFASGTAYRLDVNGDDPDTPQKDGAVEGENIVIRLDSRNDRNVVWRGGSNTRLDLSWSPVVSMAPPPVVGGGGAGAAIFGTGSGSAGPPSGVGGTSGLQVNIIGTTASVHTDPAGRVLHEARVTVGTGGMVFSIPGGARLFNDDGLPVGRVTVQPVSANVLPVPAGTAVVGQVLRLEPDGLSLEPPARMTIAYSTAQLPRGADEGKLFVAYFNNKDWEPVKSAVDSVGKTVSYEVGRAGMFALMATIVIPKPTPTSESPKTIVQPKPTPSPPARPVVVRPEPVTPPSRLPEQSVVVPTVAPTPQPPAQEDSGDVASALPAELPIVGAAETEARFSWPLIGLIAALLAGVGVFAWRTCSMEGETANKFFKKNPPPSSNGKRRNR